MIRRVLEPLLDAVKRRRRENEMRERERTQERRAAKREIAERIDDISFDGGPGGHGLQPFLWTHTKRGLR